MSIHGHLLNMAKWLGDLQERRCTSSGGEGRENPKEKEPSRVCSAVVTHEAKSTGCANGEFHREFHRNFHRIPNLSSADGGMITAMHKAQTIQETR